MLSSRSVAVMYRRLPLASQRRFERIGIVVLRSTTPCVRDELVEQIEFLYAEFHAIVCPSCSTRPNFASRNSTSFFNIYNKYLK